jgi:hypothetical protein
MNDFWPPLKTLAYTAHSVSYLVYNIFQRSRAIYREADKKEICVWVTERSKSVVLFLTSSIPKGEFNRFPGWNMCRICNIVLENSRNIILRRLDESAHETNLHP